MNKLLRRDFLGVLAAAVLPYGSALATDEQAEQAPPSAPNLPRSAQPQSSKGIAAKPAQRIASKKFADSPVILKVRPGSVVEGVSITDIEMLRSGRLVSCDGDKGHDIMSSAPGLRVNRVRSMDARTGGLIRLRGRSDDVIIRDVHYQCSAVNTDRKKISAVIQLGGKSDQDIGNNILIERVYAEGMISDYDGFLNGDIFSDEAGWSGVVYRNCYGKRASDSIFDLKSQDTVLDRCTAEGARRNFKMWYDKRSTHLISINPGQTGNGRAAHYFAKGSEKKLSVQVIEHIDFIADMPVPLIVVEEAPVEIRIRSYTCQVPGGTPIIGGNKDLAKVIWETGAPRI